MRPIQDYGLREWMVFDPVRHRFRRARNTAMLAAYKKRKIERQGEIVTALKKQARGKVAVFTVAFNSARNIDWLARGVAVHMPDAVLVVCDNSPAAEARKRIGEVCAAHAVPYVSLPPPPLARIVSTNPSLSHGTALTWIFYNFVRPLEPDIFAFFDHDLIPTARKDLRELIKGQPVYGYKHPTPRSGPRTLWRGKPFSGPWNLWAGYCVFDHAAVAHLPLDFTTDNPLRLDTGGQNWTRLYRHLDASRMRFAHPRMIGIKSPTSGETARFVLFDEAFLHIGGVSYLPNAKERLDLLEDIFETLLVERKPLDALVARAAAATH